MRLHTTEKRFFTPKETINKLKKQPRELYKTSDNPISLVRQENSKYIRNSHISKAKKKKINNNPIKN